jgi:undecaprenyl-diphosphatase
VNLLSAVFLGVIQGLTEFLPVSSSGHLAIAQHFLPGFQQPGLLFDVVLHLGTLGAVVIYLRHEVLILLSGLKPGPDGRGGRKLIWLLIIGTLPAVVEALLVGDWIEKTFENLWIVGAGLCATGVMLLLSKRFSKLGRGLADVRPSDAAVIGLVQCVALLPGVSRSGTTIVGGLGRGLAHGSAARFSFLLSIPAILGAAVFNLREVSHVDGSLMGSYIAGFLASFAVGYLAIGIVIKVLASQKFHRFGYYCLAMGGTVLVYLALHLA